jgi:mxaJ protein
MQRNQEERSMCLRFLSLRFFRSWALLAVVSTGVAYAAAPLRICADPDNLPFSNRAGLGFDNRIAVMVAQSLGRKPVFVWARSRRGFLREQFNRNACDVLMGVPSGIRSVATTRPYYRSTYVFVTPAREHMQIVSFDDKRLDGRRIGLQILEEDMAPPSLPLIRSGHAAQLVGFESFGAEEGDIVRAVSDGRVGVAVVWGPVAGYYAARLRLPVALTAVSPATDRTGIPLAFSIAMAVHRQNTSLRDDLNNALARLQPRIERVLASYHLPSVGPGGSS